MGRANFTFVLLALLVWGLVLAVGATTRRFRPSDWRRFAIAIPLALLVATTLALQLLAYDALSSVKRPLSEDSFLYWGILSECLIAIVVLLIGVSHQRR